MRVTEAELAQDLHGILEKVRRGLQITIEAENHQSLAVISPVRPTGRPITDIVRELKERNSTATLDPEFAHDLEEIIESHQQPWHPPSWD